MRGDGGDQLPAELAPDRGPDLRDLLHRRKAIEPCHQRVAQGERDRQGAGAPGIFPAIAGVSKVAGFEDRPGQFLDEQRHAVGLAEDLLEEVRRQRLAARKPRHHRRALRPGQLGERQRRDVTVMRPARGKLRPVGQHDEQRHVPDPVDQEVHHFESRRIGPVDVLEQHHRRLPAGDGLHRVGERPQRLVLEFLRRHRDGAVALLAGDREHRGDEPACPRAACRIGQRSAPRACRVSAPPCRRARTPGRARNCR